MGFQLFLVNHNFHPLTSQYVGWSHQQREFQFFRQIQGFVGCFCDPKFWVGNAIILQQGGETPPILRQIQRLETCSDDVDTVLVQFLGKLQRGLSAQLHNDTLWFFMKDDIVNMFPENRFKV